MSISEVMTIFVSIDEILFCVDYEGQIALYCIVRIFSAIDICSIYYIVYIYYTIYTILLVEYIIIYY